MARVDSGASILRVQKFTYDHSVQGNIDPTTTVILGSLPDNAIVIGTHTDTTVALGTSSGPISYSVKIGSTTIASASTGSGFANVGVTFDSDLAKLDGVQDVGLRNGSVSHTSNAGVIDIFIQYYQGV